MGLIIDILKGCFGFFGTHNKTIFSKYNVLELVNKIKFFSF